MPHIYETDGAAIYRQSFATIRAEADLARFTDDEETVVVALASGLFAWRLHRSSGAQRATAGADATRSHAATVHACWITHARS